MLFEVNFKDSSVQYSCSFLCPLLSTAIHRDVTSYKTVPLLFAGKHPVGALLAEPGGGGGAGGEPAGAYAGP
jgi:hypothetical protein